MAPILKIRSEARPTSEIPTNQSGVACVEQSRRGGFSRSFMVIKSAHVTGCSRYRVSHRQLIREDRSDADTPVVRPIFSREGVRSIRYHGAPHSDEPGARGVNITLSCRRRRPAAQESGCPTARWSGPMGPMPKFRSEERLAAGKSENYLSRAPGSAAAGGLKV